MARREQPRDLDRPADQPQLVDVRVIAEPGGDEGSRDRSGIGLVQASVTALLVAALLAIVLTTVAGGHHHSVPAKRAPTRPTPARTTAQPSIAEPTPPEPAYAQNVRGGPAAARESGPTGVAAAYGYPLRCLSVTIASADRAYARADYNRVSACGRYDGTVTAIFHRVHGEWRPELDATGYSCPIASLPAAVAAQLAVCP